MASAAVRDGAKMARLTNSVCISSKNNRVSPMKVILFIVVVIVLVPRDSESAKLKKALKKGLVLHAALQLLGPKQTAMPQMMIMPMPIAMPMPMALPAMPNSMTLAKPPCKQNPDTIDLPISHHHDFPVEVITDNSMMNGMGKGGNNNDKAMMMQMMKMMMMMQPPTSPAEPPSERPEMEVNRPEMEDLPMDNMMPAGEDQRPTGEVPQNEPQSMGPMPPPSRYEFSSNRKQAPLRLWGGHRRVSRPRSMNSLNKDNI